MCLARLPNVVNVPVAYGDDNCPLGVIDLGACLQAVNDSSPEMIAGRGCNDYAVYSIDFTEPDQPLVGHGMLSWVTLQRLSKSSPIWLAGKVTNNLLPLYAAKETLEVHLRFFPLDDRYQEDYLRSIRVYERLAGILPSDFNHSAWASFVSDNPNVMNWEEENGESEKQVQVNQVNQAQNQTQNQAQNQIQNQAQNQTQNQAQVQTQNQAQIKKVHNSNQSYKPYQHPNSIKRNYRSQEDETNSLPTRTRSISSLPSAPTASSPILDSKRYKSSSDQQYYPASSPPPATNSSFVAPNQRTTSSPLDNPNLISTNKGLIRVSSIDLSTALSFENPALKDQAVLNKARGKRKKKPAEEFPSDTQCDNCSTTKTPTWRKVRTADDTYLTFCNPCGLWYHSKKTMRPKSLWHSQKTKRKTGTTPTNPVITASSPTNSVPTASVPPSAKVANTPTVATTTTSTIASNTSTPHSPLIEKSDTVEADPSPIEEIIKSPSPSPVDDHDKENMPPPDHPEINLMFETPKKNRTSRLNFGSVTPTSKWIAKLIQPRPEEDDVFRAFLDSPSKRALNGGSSTNDHFPSAEMSFDNSSRSMDNSSIPSESLMMPSSPPSSFFYLYDENNSQWGNKQWGEDHVTPSEYEEEEGGAGGGTVKSLGG